MRRIFLTVVHGAPLWRKTESFIEENGAYIHVSTPTLKSLIRRWIVCEKCVHGSVP